MLFKYLGSVVIGISKAAGVIVWLAFAPLLILAQAVDVLTTKAKGGAGND